MSDGNNCANSISPAKTSNDPLEKFNNTEEHLSQSANTILSQLPSSSHSNTGDSYSYINNSNEKEFEGSQIVTEKTQESTLSKDNESLVDELKENVDNELGDKREKATDLSNMMARLLYMIKVLSSKNATESCICGNTVLSKLALAMRSPSSSRCLSGTFKSPSNTRSPRGCTGVSLRSPKTSPLVPGGSPSSRSLPHNQKPRRIKPTSAKRLIADSSDQVYKAKKILFLLNIFFVNFC